MADKYIVYEDPVVSLFPGTLRPVVGVYATSAEAVAAAGVDADYTSHAAPIAGSDGLGVGWWFDTSDNGVHEVWPEDDLSVQRFLWSERIASGYLDGIGQLKDWWPHALAPSARSRGENVLTEARNWLVANTHCLNSICVNPGDTGTLNTLSEDAKEKLVVHWEDLLNGGIVETWYDVGKVLDDSNANATSWRTMTSWNYTDIIDGSDGTPRSPDYSWNQMVGVPSALPSGFQADKAVLLS